MFTRSLQVDDIPYVVYNLETGGPRPRALLDEKYKAVQFRVRFTPHFFFFFFFFRVNFLSGMQRESGFVDVSWRDFDVVYLVTWNFQNWLAFSEHNASCLVKLAVVWLFLVRNRQDFFSAGWCHGGQTDIFGKGPNVVAGKESEETILQPPAPQPIIWSQRSVVSFFFLFFGKPQLHSESSFSPRLSLVVGKRPLSLLSKPRVFSKKKKKKLKREKETNQCWGGGAATCLGYRSKAKNQNAWQHYAAPCCIHSWVYNLVHILTSI